jgi:6-phosphogluconolactonase
MGETPPDRITLTYPVLASSRVTTFLVAGEGKRDALARVRAGDQSLPASRLQSGGDIYWFVDRAAAATLAYSSTK